MTFWERKRLEKRIGAMVPRLRIITRAWGCAPDLGDDLVQESVSIALDKLGQLRDPAALEVWVIRIINNCHRLHYRRHRGLTELDEGQLVDEVTPANSLENEQMLAEVRNAISKLDDEHRKLIVLVDMEGMSYRDVAEALELRIGTVMSRLHRARGKLRVLLKEALQDDDDNKDVKPSVLWRVK